MNNKHWDALWIHSTLATMKEGAFVPYGLLTDAAIAIKDEKIVWIGTMSDLPEKSANFVYDVEGRLITPGLIDCHTHLVYAGNRCEEFEMRMQGKSYADIARAGGGIRATVAATRLASETDLYEQSVKRAKALTASGATTIEIKSGYGLDKSHELKMLRVAKQIGERLPLTVKTTFLGAHAVPQEFEGRAEAYIDFICDEMIPLIVKEKYADYIDVFCETIGFTLEQTERVFIAAKRYGLKIKCHAEQLSHLESAALAAKYGALSVDHLEYLSRTGAEAMAQSGTVAVLLPSAFYFLREKKLPPIDLLRSLGIPMALASDCNPGTSPMLSLLSVMNMGCILFGLTAEEALLGLTRQAAKALGLLETCGTLEVGKQADLVVWNVENPAELVYWMGKNDLMYQRVVRGLLPPAD
jgi:imidazolonepropionase